MDDNFFTKVKDVITYSKEEALRLGHDFIAQNIMLGILRDGNGKAISFKQLDIDLNHLRRKVEILSNSGSRHKY
jgi:ATP-dependent Clp protease ATP-binding subunit ClpC